MRHSKSTKNVAEQRIIIDSGKLAKEIESRGLNKSALARESGVSRSRIHTLTMEHAYCRASYANVEALCRAIGCEVSDISYQGEDAGAALDLSAGQFRIWLSRKRPLIIDLEMYSQNKDRLVNRHSLRLIATDCASYYRFENADGDAVGFCELKGQSFKNANVIAVFDDLDKKSKDIIVIHGAIDANGQINNARAYRATKQPYDIFAVIRRQDAV